jgi:hypothetical protein
MTVKKAVSNKEVYPHPLVVVVMTGAERRIPFLM